MSTSTGVANSAMAGWGIGHAHFMDLIFSPMEVVAVVLSVAIVVVLNQDGQTNWFEGALLLAVNSDEEPGRLRDRRRPHCTAEVAHDAFLAQGN